MKKVMLINAVHHEQKRMATVESGKLVEFNIQMFLQEPITGNIYKGIVLKIERGLQAAFVNYGGKRDGFLPLHDVSSEYFAEQNDIGKENGQTARSSLKIGQEVIIQVLREESVRKGALLTTYISLPGRYLVLLPNKSGSGISRKIESEEDRKRLKDIVEQIKVDEGMGLIVRTAGVNRTKQELSRDYQHLSRLWKEIKKKASAVSAPALIYQVSDFSVRSLRDYLTPDVEEILVDDVETFKKMRAYCKTVTPRNVGMIKLYREKAPIFDKYQLEEQIRIIYQDRVDLRSGGYIIINPTEAMTTIDVNSGRASNRRNVEETAFKTNIEAAEEIGRQLRLRDLGGLLVIDFIDMMDKKHEAEVEKAFKRAISMDRARIQLSRISKFGLLELSRQKKQSTIQEISYTTCPFCQGRGVRPSLEYTALSAFRKIESQAVRGLSSVIRVTLPYEVSEYLLNQKRSEIGKLETMHDLAIHISGNLHMAWDRMGIELIGRKVTAEITEQGEKLSEAVDEKDVDVTNVVRKAKEDLEEVAESIQQTIELMDRGVEPAEKKTRRRSRHRRKKTGVKPAGMQQAPREKDGPLLSEIEAGILSKKIILPATLSDGQEMYAFVRESDEDAPVPETKESGKQDEDMINSIIMIDKNVDILPE
jgi:ribonuclease E